MAKHLTVAISESRSDDPARQTVQREIAASLEIHPGVDVAVLPHLYDLAVDGPAVEYLRSIEGDLIVAASLYARTIYWLLDAAEVKGRRGWSSFDADEQAKASPATSAERDDKVPDRTIWCLDVRPHKQAGALLEEIGRIVADTNSEPSGPGAEKLQVDETVAFRWYPVVDYDRCANCLECLNFCLFGVFGVDASGRLLVEQPDACRDGCPACARVCPSGAIMFPRHDDPGMAGDPKAPVGGGSLIQLLGDVNQMDTAAAERDHAVAEKAEADKDDLEQLVDDLDDMDL